MEPKNDASSKASPASLVVRHPFFTFQFCFVFVCVYINCALGRRWDTSKEQYEVKELIGRGSSGRVFRAIRKEDKLQVAIKLMGHDVEGGTAKHRQEFEIMKGVSHPNLVAALDYFKHPSGSVLVLAYVPSITLTTAVKSRASKVNKMATFLAEGRAETLFRMLIDALSYLHSRRIIHSETWCFGKTKQLAHWSLVLLKKQWREMTNNDP